MEILPFVLFGRAFASPNKEVIDYVFFLPCMWQMVYLLQQIGHLPHMAGKSTSCPLYHTFGAIFAKQSVQISDLFVFTWVTFKCYFSETFLVIFIFSMYKIFFRHMRAVVKGLSRCFFPAEFLREFSGCQCTSRIKPRDQKITINKRGRDPVITNLNTT